MSAKLKRERIEHVEHGALAVVGQVTMVILGGVEYGIIAPTLAHLAVVVETLVPSEKFDPKHCQRAAHIRIGDVTLDDEL